MKLIQVFLDLFALHQDGKLRNSMGQFETLSNEATRERALARSPSGLFLEALPSEVAYDPIPGQEESTRTRINRTATRSS